MALSSLEKSILYTLAYSAQFEYPLTQNEIWQRLLKRLDPETYLLQDTSTTLEEVGQAIQHLKDQQIIYQQHEYLHLPGKSPTVLLRQQRLEIAQTKWQEVKQIKQLLLTFPWIEAVYVTGSLAMNNVEEPDDIDFMIITTPQRLWLTRLWLTWLAFRRGKRRSWQGEEARSWCFNVWLERDQLSVLSSGQSVYIAYELTQARCVLDRGHVCGLLEYQTPWVADILPNSNWGTGDFSHENSSAGHPAQSLFWQLLNLVAYLGQRLYMFPHQTREKVSLGYAFFHPRDTESWIWQRWITTLISIV